MLTLELDHADASDYRSMEDWTDQPLRRASPWFAWLLRMATPKRRPTHRVTDIEEAR